MNLTHRKTERLFFRKNELLISYIKRIVPFGRYYDSHPQRKFIPNARLHIDSIHKRRNGGYDSLSLWKPDSSWWSDDRIFFNEIYNRPAETPPYVYRVSYSKNLKNIDQFYSKKLDSSRDMKLSKIILVTKEGYSNRYKTVIPRFEMYGEMKEIPVEHKNEVLFILKSMKRNAKGANSIPFTTNRIVQQIKR